MSTNLNLVIYRRENGELIEENLKTVRCEEISPTLLKLITDSFPVKETKVYFDRRLEESFEIQHFENSDTANIIKILHECFHELLKHENNILNASGGEDSEQSNSTQDLIANILPDQNHTDPTWLAIARFRILTGIIGLFADKQNKLADETGAIIKLG